MKLSFMSFVAPDWSLNELLTAAIRYGYDGIEPRAEAGHKHGIELDTTKKQRKEIAARFRDCEVELCCIATSRTYALPDDKLSESIDLTLRYIDLAHDCGCDKLRVFGGMPPAGMSSADAKKRVAEGLAACCEHAASAGVFLCLETHDAFCNTQDVVEVLRAVNHPNAAANWDIMHPYRAGQSMQQAFEDLQPYIKHCHFHDGVWPSEAPDKLELTPVGEGLIPHDEAIQLLATMNYEGYLSGEWIAAFEPEVILPHDVQVMRRYIEAAESSR